MENDKRVKTYSAEEVRKILQYKSIDTIYRLKDLSRVKQRRRLLYREEDLKRYLDLRTAPAVLTSPLPQPQTTPAALIPKRIRLRHPGNGTFYVRKSKRFGVRYYADFTPPGQKRRRAVVKNATGPEDVYAYIRMALAARPGIPPGPELFFRDWAEEYLKTYAFNKKSIRTDKWLISVLLPYFGECPVSSIKEKDIWQMRNDLITRGWKESSTNRVLAILSRMYNLAKRSGIASTNPVEYIPRFGEAENQIQRILELDEEKRLLKAADSGIAPMIILALNTGLRLGEVLALRWMDLDFRNHTLRVSHAKSKKPRHVRMNTLLEETLRTIPAAGEHVFVNPKTKTRYVCITRAWHRACEKSGIRKLRFHDLRHTFATRLAENHVPIHRIKKLMGHSDIRLTERYTHASDEGDLEAVQGLVESAIPVDDKLNASLARFMTRRH